MGTARLAVLLLWGGAAASFVVPPSFIGDSRSLYSRPCRPRPPCAEKAGDSAQDVNSVEAVAAEVLGVLRRRRAEEAGLQEGLGQGGELGITWMEGGSTNYCFCAFNEEQPTTRRVFVKLARDFVRGFDEWARLSRRRVWYEKEGFLELDRHEPGCTPRVLHVDASLGLLVTEWLDGFLPYQQLLGQGSTGPPHLPSQLARLAARCHASSMVRDGAYLAACYSNQEHIDFWNRCFFAPLHEVLLQPHTSPHASRPFLAPLVARLNTQRALTRAVSALHDTYQFKKQALLHADLHCNNILLKPPPEDGSGGGGWQLKIIDAEKYYYGPAGMDVGQLMANYAWHLAVSDERAGADGAPMGRALAKLWDGYGRHFREAAAYSGMDEQTARRALGEVSVDGVGLLGLWVLFLSVACPVQIMAVPGLGAQDPTHTQAFERLVKMAAACLHWYDERRRRALSADHEEKEPLPTGLEMVELLRRGYLLELQPVGAPPDRRTAQE